MRVALPFFAIVAFLVGCGRKEKAMIWSDPLDPIAITTDSVASRAKPVLLVIHEVGPHWIEPDRIQGGVEDRRRT